MPAPPAAPAATVEPPAPNPPAPPKNEPSLRNIYRTFGLVVEDDYRLNPIPDGERMAETDRVAAIAPVVPPTPPPADPPAPPANGVVVQPPPAPPPPPLEVRQPATEQILDLQKKVQADLAKFSQRLDEASKPPSAPPAPAEAPKPANPDASFEAGLPDENRETIDLLRWAEESGQAEFKGKAADYIGCLKRLDEFRKANPEAGVEALDEFREKNKPHVAESAVRKLSRDRIKAEVKAEARAEVRTEMAPELDALRRRQYELEIKPVLAEASREFKMRFSAETVELPDGVARIDPVAAEEALGGGEAAKKHKIIAPIIQFHAAAVDEYMDLSHGLKAYESGNQIHRFLDQFIFHQEQVLLKAPAEKQLRDGKQFLPTLKYQEAWTKDRAATEAKYWNFNHEDVRRMLEINAHRQAADKRKEIAEAAKSMGFSEPSSELPKPPATNPPPAAPPLEPPSQSPKAAGTRMPGAASAPATPSELTKVLGSVYPPEVLANLK